MPQRDLHRSHSTATICLVILTKNERDNLAACIEAARELVDEILVIDTGSSDGTIDLARQLGAEVIHRRWINFAHNRTEALALACDKDCGYTLMLDADHELVLHDEMPKLEADSYLIRIEDHWGGRLPLLTRAAHPFRYEGAAHAYLTSDAPTRTETLDAFSIKGGGGASREKLERDLTELTRAFAEDPNDARTVFYLAQTYRDLDRPQEAIRFYRLRAEMQGFDEETFFARFQLGVLLGEHESFSLGARELLAAWDMRRTRVEPLRALARLADSVADKYPMPDDALFVMPGAYREAA